MNEFWEFLIITFGYMLIWAAIDYKRPDEFKFRLYQKERWFQMFLVITGVLIILSQHK